MTDLLETETNETPSSRLTALAATVRVGRTGIIGARAMEMAGLLRTETNETPSPRLTAWAMASR